MAKIIRDENVPMGCIYKAKKLNEMEWIDYPDHDDLMEGPTEGVVYSYVSSTYINGFINYVDIIDAYMARRYKSLRINYNPEVRGENYLCWEDSCSLIDAGGKPHTNLGISAKFDDIHVLGKCGNYYYYFWSDKDCSDCCIGKISTDNYPLDDVKKDFKKLIIEVGCFDSYNDENENEFIKQIPVDFFKGWITL